MQALSLERIRKSRRAHLIPFLMVGDPNLEMTERLVLALIEEGASAIELGIPFSDAFADGPVIQKSSERALAQHVTLDLALDLAKRIHSVQPKVPLIVFSYLNPILKYGIENYVAKAKQSGIFASLVVDLPPEEAEEYFEAHETAGLGTAFLASPTTSNERLNQIQDFSTAFIYVVSRNGVTGEQNELSTTLGAEISRVRAQTSLPLAVGFGISNSEQARQVAQFADSIVVGSAFVKRIEQNLESPVLIEEAVRNLARDLMRGLDEVDK